MPVLRLYWTLGTPGQTRESITKETMPGHFLTLEQSSFHHLGGTTMLSGGVKFNYCIPHTQLWSWCCKAETRWSRKHRADRAPRCCYHQKQLDSLRAAVNQENSFQFTLCYKTPLPQQWMDREWKIYVFCRLPFCNKRETEPTATSCEGPSTVSIVNYNQRHWPMYSTTIVDTWAWSGVNMGRSWS